VWDLTQDENQADYNKKIDTINKNLPPVDWDAQRAAQDDNAGVIMQHASPSLWEYVANAKKKREQKEAEEEEEEQPHLVRDREDEDDVDNDENDSDYEEFKYANDFEDEDVDSNLTAVEKQEEMITDYDSSAEFRPAGKRGCNTADTDMRDEDEDEDEDEHGDKMDDEMDDEMEHNTAFQVQEEMNKPTVGAGYKSDPDLPDVPRMSGTIHQFVL
jgi:hypothetical protein